MSKTRSSRQTPDESTDPEPEEAFVPPLGGVSRVLAPVAPGEAAAGEYAPSTPERVLGTLLAPLGSVLLAHELSEAPGSTDGAEPTSTGARALRERVDRRLGELRRAVGEPLRAPFEGRGRLAGPAEVHARMEELCVDKVKRREIRDAAAELSGPFHDRVGAAVRRARGIVGGVRARLSEDLRALGPEAARLEELDALVGDHTSAKTSELFDRISAIFADHFESELAAAVAAAAEPPPRRHVDAWFVEEGWIARHIERCQETVLAVFEHERRALLGLVTAACEVQSE